jgi:hypothetical protein
MQLESFHCMCGARTAAGLLPTPHHACPCIALGSAPPARLQDLADLAKPGDRITVTGVYRAMGVRTNPRLRELKVGGWKGASVCARACACRAGWLAGRLPRTVPADLATSWPKHIRMRMPSSLNP